MKHPFLLGERIYLRGVTEQDFTEAMFQWTNDRQVTRYLFRGAYPNSVEAARQAYAASIASSTDVELAVVERETERVVGLTGIHGIQWVPRSAEFRILLGEPDVWNKGYGTETTQWMAVYAFEVLNLNRLWLGVVLDNAGGVQAYERAGFVREGLLRQEVFRNSRHYDVVRMSMLVNEYQRVKTAWAIAPRNPRAVPRVAILGCGRIGSRLDEEGPQGLVLSHASAFAAIGVTPVAFCDPDADRLTECGRRRGVERLYRDPPGSVREGAPRHRLYLHAGEPAPGYHSRCPRVGRALPHL